MFTTLSGFSSFYFILSGLILSGLLFEDKLIALEDRYDEYKKSKKSNKKSK